ncbi:hypothetical protein IC757_14025 [Wenzhouxiangella sp. AB-CW3]|uniref:hypothetical protein n=1 Tax=Wenzhouxiangella sp. AB-CW3 TaxID=2771012 RepID=UPI00168B7065|nr:hypothetical protein [Wenzhouxiangella sp. AB-CW3]QOC22125.1 hypothetical protein IC757_14025 [Wenzhouxiangella sp. AB-CW3]
MKKLYTPIALLVALAVSQPALAKSELVHGHPVETDNLLIVWADEYDEETQESVKLISEQLYDNTVAFLQKEPAEKVTVVFRGRARVGPGPARDYPFVDSAGVISLFRYTDEIRNYFHAFVHELVHALRIDRAESADWFFEEGFAEFVRLRVFESMHGFPWHGFSPSIVAAGHIVEGSDIPLETLRDQHEQLNIPCRAQAYSLRSAFFEWLGDSFGDEAVLKMSREQVAGQAHQYEQYFGSSLSALAKQWRKETRKLHDAEKFRDYRSNTPIKHIPLCNY